MLPATKRGWSMTAERNGRLWPIPSTSNASSAVAHRLDRLGAVRRPGAELGDHRVVEHARSRRPRRRRCRCARRAPSVCAFDRRAVAGQPPDRGQEVAVGILGIEAAFDRPAVELHVVLRERQLLAGRDADHLLHEVDAGDQFRHRMLDLQARVHLEEVEVAVAVDDELDRAGASIAHRLGQRARPARPWPCGSPRRGRATAPPR